VHGLVIIHSFILAISIVPLQVYYYSEALPTTARILYRSFTPKRTMGQFDCRSFQERLVEEMHLLITFALVFQTPSEL